MSAIAGHMMATSDGSGQYGLVRHIKRVAYNSGESRLVAFGGDLGIPS